MSLSLAIIISLGSQLIDLVPLIQHLRSDNFAHYPYLYHSSQQSEQCHSSIYYNNDQAIAVQAVDTNNLIKTFWLGSSWKKASITFPSIHNKLHAEGYNPQKIYYCEEVIFNTDFKTTYDIVASIEHHAQKLSYDYLLFVSIIPEQNSLKPLNYQGIESTLLKLSFKQTNIVFSMNWSTFTDLLGNYTSKNHIMNVWIKSLI